MRSRGLLLLGILFFGCMILVGCGSQDNNLWEEYDQTFFFHDLQDGDRNVPINAVFGIRPSSAVKSMTLYDSNGDEVDSNIHEDNDGHWYLSPVKFLNTFSWYGLEIDFENGNVTQINFKTGGDLPSNAAPVSGNTNRVGYNVKLPGSH